MLAIVPARGGSKGLPGKTTASLGGKPVIAWTIEAALDARSISRVVVSTEDAGIAEVARQFGAETPFLRPAELATDAAATRDVVLHALASLSESQAEPISEFCLLQPTSPFRRAEHVDEAVELFRATSADSVIAVTEFEHPVQWALRLGDDGRIIAPAQQAGSQRQGCEIYWRPNGAIYVCRAAHIQASDSFYGPDSYAYKMCREDSLDIDTPMDLSYCEFLLQRRAADK